MMHTNVSSEKLPPVSSIDAPDILPPIPVSQLGVLAQRCAAGSCLNRIYCLFSFPVRAPEPAAIKEVNEQPWPQGGWFIDLEEKINLADLQATPVQTPFVLRLNCHDSLLQWAQFEV